MSKTQKNKSHARRAASAAKSSLKQFVPDELAAQFHSVASADFPNVNWATLRLCALALTSK